MTSELEVAVSDQELAYRSKYYHDIRAVRQRELSCASCGNVISDEAGQVFSHSIFGVLQCRQCKEHFEDVTFNSDDSESPCYICGREFSQTRNSHRCGQKNCPFEYCETCIKRNAPQALVDVKTERWKCFACNSKPLWKLRGACAAVMSLIPKRTKRKKVSRNRSSDREGVRSNLKKISYVERCQRTESEKLKKRLKSVCDEDSPPTPRSLYSRNYASSQHLSVVTPSDDSEIEILPTWKKKQLKQKLQATNSLETSKKSLTNVTKDSRKKKIFYSGGSRDTRKKVHNVATRRSRKMSLSNSDSSDSDSYTVHPKESRPSTLGEKNANDQDKTSVAKRKVTAESSGETSEDESVQRSNDKRQRSSTTSATSSNRGKSSGKPTREREKSSKRFKTIEEDNSEDKRPTGSRKSSRTPGPNIRTKHESAASRDGKLRRSTRDKSSEEDFDPSLTVGTEIQRSRNEKNRQSRDEEKSRNKSENMDEKTRKSFDQKAKFCIQKSDSSSGKEFFDTKLLRKSYVSLKPISELQEDRTRSPSDSPKEMNDVMPKGEAFELKNTVRNFLDEMEAAAKKVLNDIECAKKMYMKDSMRSMDADRMMIKTKSIVKTFRQHVDHGEKRLVDSYDKWCKKTRVKNVLRKRSDRVSSSSKKSPKKVSTKPDESGNESSTSMRHVSPPRARKSSKSLENLNLLNGEKNPVVSDCDSDDIFSGDEREKSVQESDRASSSREDRTKSLNVEESSKNEKNGSAEDIEDVGEKHVDNSLERQERKSVLAENFLVTRESVDPSDEDIFETSGSQVEAPNVDEVSVKSINDKKSSKNSSERKSEKLQGDDEECSKSITETQSPQKKSSNDQQETVESSDSEMSTGNESKKSPVLSHDENEIFTDIETNRDEPLNNNERDEYSEITTDDISTKKTDDTQGLTIEKSSSPEKNVEAEQEHEKIGSDEVSDKDLDSIHDAATQENSEVQIGQREMEKINEGEDEEEKIPSLDTALAADDENETDKSSSKSPVTRNSEGLFSLETILGDNDESERPGLKSPVARNSEGLLSLETIFGNNDESERPGLKSPVARNSEGLLSLETILGDNDESERSGLKSPVAKNSEGLFSLETILGDNDESERPGLKSPVAKNSAKSSVDDNKNEKSGSKSPVSKNYKGRSSVDTVASSDGDNASEKSGSKSPVGKNSNRRSSVDISGDSDNDNESKRSGTKSTVEKKKTSKISKSCGSDEDTEKPLSLSDDFYNTTNKSGSESPSNNNLRGDSTSSEISEGDNLRMRDALLASSNSDDSSHESSFPSRRTSTRETEETPPTPPESDSNSCKSMKKKLRDRDNRDKVRTRRGKFRIEDNRHIMADIKLKQLCDVQLERLDEKSLYRHTRALNKSRDYVESKELKRLVNLDDLDKDKKVAETSSSENETASISSKDLKNKKKKQAAREREETLMDHLEKVGNGSNIELSDGESNVEGTQKKEDSKNKGNDKNEESVLEEANRMAKKHLLESSDSAEEDAVVSEPGEKAEEEEKTKKTKKVVKKAKLDKSSEDEEEKQDKSDKGRWRKNNILTLKISDSDSEDEKKKFNASQKKLADKKKQKGSQSESEEEETPKKKRVRRRVLHSDSDVKISDLSDSDDSDDSADKKKKQSSDSDDDDEMKEVKKKPRKRIKRGRRSSDSSDSMEEKRPKNRRKRIKTAGTDSDSENDLENSQGTPGKSGRKNIRKVLRDKQVADDTKQAARDEEERLKRIAERQKLYNEMYENRLAGEEKVEKLVLDFDDETKEPLVSVHESLVKRLKPHQARGIKFMWDACFESLERIKSTTGSGCILAHCMGLGKTFQVVSLSHTLLQHSETGIKTIMVVCPLSTVLNWVNEFKIWLSDIDDDEEIEVYELTKWKKNFERKYQLETWRKNGGVMIIGYEMFRNLSSTGKKVRKNIQDSFLKCLVDPGPDLVVCDEGHLLKNEDTALSKAMRRVKTLRRIVLTGTPLQNNLIEYHCMVSFVKPNLLGTKKEFMNRFENPITNGQFDDSTEYDVKLMKKRAHVLHKMLEGSVQRLDYSVLTPFLPPKQEYVIFVKLTEIQIKMYRHYLEYYARRHRGVGGSLFADFQALQRIWTHPLVMQMNAEKVVLANEKKRQDATDSEGSLKDFIDDGSDSDSSDSSDIRSVNGSDEDASKKPKRATRANPVVDEPLPAIVEKSEETNDEIEWWTQFVREEDYEDMRISSKLLILFRILKESEQIGDKVLVFSQSLYSLTLIERFLALIDDETQCGNEPDPLDNHAGSWSLGLDYFRLDGQSSTDNRRRWCDIFNKPSNTRARLFLISTRAGGLGINLTAANRVIIFDASWNPSHDVQSIFRIYRFGQKKPCYVYRLLAAGTMEEKIYNRQVTKLSLSCRVVDEQQIERHYSNNALAELYQLEISHTETTLKLPKDRLLAEIFLKYKHCVDNYHEHDSLLENQASEELDEEERQLAWLEYEEEKKGKRQMQPMQPMLNTYQNEILMQQMNMMNLQQQNVLGNPAMMADFENLQRLMSKDYPGVPEAQHKMMASRAIYEMYNYVERQAMSNQRIMPMVNQNPKPIMNPAGQQIGYEHRVNQAGTSLRPTAEMMRLYQQSLVQQQHQHNGHMNYQMNNGMMGDPLALSRNNPINPQIPQLGAQSSTTVTLDDDIVEIPSSPEKNLVPPPPVPGGSRKSQEE